MLKETLGRMNRNGAPGVDRVSVEEYAKDLEAHVSSLVERQRYHRACASHMRA